MLQQSFRLRSSVDFSKTYKYGRSINSANFYIKYLATKQPVSKLAVVISKKVAKKAVVRNKIRRRFIEAIRQKWQIITPGYNIIITIKSDVSSKNQAEIQAEILNSLKRAHLINETKSNNPN